MATPTPEAQKLWAQDTIQFAREQDIDLGRQVLLSMAEEFGYWKIIIIVLLFMGVTLGFGIWKLVGTLKRRGAGGGSANHVPGH